MTKTRPADPEIVAQLQEAEALRQRALLDADVDSLDALFDEHLVHIHAPGLTHSKQQLLEHTATRRPYLSIARGALTYRVIGDAAIVTGELTNRLRTAEGGERTVTGAVTQVLAREDDRWVFVSFQMTPYGEQAWPTLPSQDDAEGAEQEDGR